ncbi:hypothetical protein ACE6H2_024188 [Prunus campanulata]
MSLDEPSYHHLKKRRRSHAHHRIRNKYGENMISSDLHVHKSEQIKENNNFAKEQLGDLQQPPSKTMYNQI